MKDIASVIIGVIETGQRTCHDARGNEVLCTGSGQDAEFKRGIPWPEPRFELKDETVI
jgi:hypothetical protein